MSKIIKIEAGVFKAPLKLSEKLEQDRDFYMQVILDAQKRIRTFAEEFKWKDLITDPFFKGVEIYSDKKDFDNALRKSLKLHKDFIIPESACAALENEILFSVSKELYRKIYPEGDEQNAFEKLLAHEIAHRLHIRILEGNEDAMGPIWFFEGFAIYAAGQFEGDKTKLTKTEIKKVISTQDRISYRKYALVIREILKKISLHEAVMNAFREDFNEWIVKDVIRDL